MLHLWLLQRGALLAALLLLGRAAQSWRRRWSEIEVLPPLAAGALAAACGLLLGDDKYAETVPPPLTLSLWMALAAHAGAALLILLLHSYFFFVIH